MKSKTILPEENRRFKTKDLIPINKPVLISYIQVAHNALLAAESEIEEKNQEIMGKEGSINMLTAKISDLRAEIERLKNGDRCAIHQYSINPDGSLGVCLRCGN